MTEEKTNKTTFSIYIPEEGHWPIPGKHTTVKEARCAYLQWAERQRLPAGAVIDRTPVDIYAPERNQVRRINKRKLQ